MIYKILRKLNIEEKDLPSFLGKPLFRLWWSKERKSAPPELAIMMDHLVSSASFASLSPYWTYLARKNIIQLTRRGLENFKQTVARDYFVIVDWKRNYYYENLTKGYSREELEKKYGNIKQHEYFNSRESESYNVFTSLLLEHVLKLSESKRYLTLEEPSMGNPAFITHEGKRITSDLLNSILDYDSLFHSISENEIKTVLEVGGGYGRNAFCNISLLPNLKRYIMVDIPPALFLAQSYISTVFPNKKVFQYRPFTSFAEVEKEFNESELVFLLPEQIALLPDKSIDLGIAIDCLHEMDKAQVEKYFHDFDRLTSRFYFRCSIETRKIFYQWKDYPVLPTWKEIINRPTFIPAGYFESLCEMDKNIPK